MIHLDTHVVVWLHAGQVERIPEWIRGRIGRAVPTISPMVRLELQLLFDVGRITLPAAQILADLERDADLRVSEAHFARVAAIAATLTFTRDPFDRMIAAQALADDVPLLTKDRRLLAHCPVAIWHPPAA